MYTVLQGGMSLLTYYLEYGRHVVRLHHRCCSHRRAYAPTRTTAGHNNMRKSICEFRLFPYMGMGLLLAAWQSSSIKEQGWLKMEKIRMDYQQRN